MNTERTWQIESTSLSDTLAIAEQLGARLIGGEVLQLVSDLGGGKTAFVRGLAQGIGSKDLVKSPSFTLSNHYQGSKLRLYHYDFYRLENAGIMRQELAEATNDQQAVVVVEWADIVEDVLPEGHIIITIRATGESSRHIAANYTKNKAYIFEDA